jgi:hypothetical protein
MYCKTLNCVGHSKQKVLNADICCRVPPWQCRSAYTADCTWALLEHFNWELFDYLPYSPDLAPNNYHLFTYLKNWLWSQRFNSNELVEGVKTWLSSRAADFFDTCIQKLIPGHDKCLNSGGDYAEE